MPQLILVIDDEEDLIKLVKYNLEKQGYLVLSAKDGSNGLRLAQNHHPDLIILDIMLPDTDGLDLLRLLRQDQRTSGIPIIMLTAKAEEVDKILGLELGADEYITKPFSIKEFLARVRALFRMTQRITRPEEVLKFDQLIIDTGRHEVKLSNKRIELTATEFNILKFLASKRGRVSTREEIICNTMGDDTTIFDRTIDVHIMSIRKKLGRYGKLIQTIRGVGYRLSER
jgi:DNA-binding response OmpR family regulator